MSHVLEIKFCVKFQRPMHFKENSLEHSRYLVTINSKRKAKTLWHLELNAQFKNKDIKQETKEQNTKTWKWTISNLSRN